MTAPIIVTGKFHLRPTPGRRRSQQVSPGELAADRVPRVARLLALAIKLDAEVSAGGQGFPRS